MPRQTRASSGAAAAANPYPTHASMAGSAMYNHRMMSNEYFAAMPAPPADPLQMAPQHHHAHSHHHQPSMPGRSFDSSSNTTNAYAAHTAAASGATAPAIMTPSTPAMVSLPPSHRPSSGAWTPQDDQQLMAARAQGLNWSQIKDLYFPGKTANACRKRHERLAERRDADDWDNRKFQRLAKEYMTMRKEIWSGLAARTGEKWNVVEQKCMTNGLKNLQSASRAASRHDRLQSQSAAAAAAVAMASSSSGGGGGGGGPLSGYDDDSGISGIALTPVDDLDASFSSPSSAGSYHRSSGSSSHGYQHHHSHHSLHSLHDHDHHHGGHHSSSSRYPQQLHPNMQFGLPLPPPPSLPNVPQYIGGPYGMPVIAPPPMQQNHHRYPSSVSSSASASGGYHGSGGSVGGGSSRQGSPYMRGQRLPSVDMGIGSIINRGL